MPPYLDKIKEREEYLRVISLAFPWFMQGIVDRNFSKAICFSVSDESGIVWESSVRINLDNDIIPAVLSGILLIFTAFHK